MVRRYFAWIVPALFTVGCSTIDQPVAPIQSPYQDLHDKRIKEADEMAFSVEDALKKMHPDEVLQRSSENVVLQLKDPESVRFRNLRFIKHKERIVICGEVNAKNSFGGYVGFQVFVAGLTAAKIMNENEYKTAFGSADTAGVRSYCLLGDVFKP